MNVLYYGSLDEYTSEVYEITLPRGKAIDLTETIARKLLKVRPGNPREFFNVASVEEIPAEIRAQRDEEYRTYHDREIKNHRKHAADYNRYAEVDSARFDDPRRQKAWYDGAMSEVKWAEGKIHEFMVAKANRLGTAPPPPREELFGEDENDFGDVKPKGRGRSKVTA